MASPFDVLRVDPDADEEEVEAAFRRRVKEAHPDQGGSAEEFRMVREAYEAILSGEAADDVDVVAEPDADRNADGREREPGVRVEYLDYEVLDDHGWSLDDDDLFEKAAATDLDGADYGRLRVDDDEPLLESAEDEGRTWPFACRGGACANCAVAVVEGELSMPVDHILPPEMLDRGIRLSCVGRPATEELKVVYNVKGLPDLDDLRLPPYPFERANVDG